MRWILRITYPLLSFLTNPPSFHPHPHFTRSETHFLMLELCLTLSHHLSFSMFSSWSCFASRFTLNTIQITLRTKMHFPLFATQSQFSAIIWTVVSSPKLMLKCHPQCNSIRKCCFGEMMKTQGSAIIKWYLVPLLNGSKLLKAVLSCSSVYSTM